MSRGRTWREANEALGRWQAEYHRKLEARIQELEARLKGDNDGRDPYIADLKARIKELEAELDYRTMERDVAWKQLHANLGERQRLLLARIEELEAERDNAPWKASYEWMRDQRDRAQQTNADLLAAIRKVLNELGVPNEDTSAPVANAVAILTAAAQGEET